MKEIKVKLKNNPYGIYIDDNLPQKLPGYLTKLKLGNFAIVVTSPNLLKLYKNDILKMLKGVNFAIAKVPAGESAKSQSSLFSTLNKIAAHDGFNKKIFLVCFGGGTIGDLGGFAASIYKRGIPYIQIPTTLLSQIDSSIGGKTAIDLSQAKNIIGTFYQPKAVFICPKFLSTLSKKEIKEGMAEAIKYSIIQSQSFFDFLKRNNKKVFSLNKAVLLKIIYTCAAIKAKIVGEDELEKKGIRTVLNLGHTLAHALEASLKYKGLTHGQAVSLGLLFAANLSIISGKTKPKTLENIKRIIYAYGLPSKITFNFNSLYNALRYDKKFISGKVRMVLIKRIGKALVVEGIPLKNIKKSLEYFA